MRDKIVFEGPVSRLEKDQDWTGPRPIKTVTVVQSSVYVHFRNLKTKQRLVLVVSTGVRLKLCLE